MPARAGQGWLGALQEGMMLISLFLRGNHPSKKHHLGARLFPQLLSSCYPKFLATFILIFFPMGYFQPFLGLFKAGFITSLLSPGLMCLAQSRRTQQSRSPGPAGGGRGAAGCPPLPQRQAGLGLNTCSHLSRNR